MDKMDRKSFLKKCARGSAAAVLVLFGGRHILKSRNASETSHICMNQGICRGCGAFQACILPQAASAKKAKNMDGYQK